MSRSALVAAVLGAAVLGAGGAIAGRSLLPSRAPAPAPAAPRADDRPRGPAPPAGFVEFRDELFSIAYPAGWTRQESRDPEVEILATGERSASFLVRVVPLNFDVGPANVEAAK